jgi:hypothetical protein
MATPKPDHDFKQITVGRLAARVYKDGRVVIGAFQVGDAAGGRIEVEITTNHENGLRFADELSGLIKVMSGAYE